MPMSEQTEYAYDVFISYSHQDEEWVTGMLLPRLEEAGLRVCIDFRDFVAGKPALLNMQDAALDSRHTVLVSTPAWMDSQWTLLEGLLTRTDDPAGLRLRTGPLLLEPCDLPPFISMLTWVDFSRADRLDIAWTQLLTALGAPLGHLRRPAGLHLQSGLRRSRGAPAADKERISGCVPSA
jgi:hypothetical protein